MARRKSPSNQLTLDGSSTLDAATPTIPSRTLVEEVEAAFLEYSMSVIVSRALPDVRDGLKPVQRRILWAMHDANLRPDRPFVKCARVVGDVMANYHPHGDSAIYDALVRMGQPFSLTAPLIDKHGNFGSPVRPARREPLHRVPALAARDGAARRHRRGHRRLRAQLRRVAHRAGRAAGAVPEPARERRAGDRGRAWPPTSRRTTSPRCATRR